jgi:hypothetical protein
MEVWMMPLIFVISGASLFYAMNKGGIIRFLKDKFLRLLLPLLVVVFTHASLQVYLERLTHGQFRGTYFQFLPHYFDGMYLEIGSSGNFAWAGMHMWYVVVLFLFSLLFYPLLRWLKSGGKRILEVSGSLLAFPGAMFLLALPLIVLESVTSDTGWGDFGAGGWPFVLYIPFFLAGFVIISSRRLQDTILRIRWFSLLLGLLVATAYLFLVFNADRLNIVALKEEIDDPLVSLAAWCFLLAFLGFGRQYLNTTTPLLKYANEAVLPFYILHQTVLLVIGYFVVQWQIPALLKWLIIVPTSFTIIMLLYEFLVRRSNLLRVLFGMKTLRRIAPATTPVLARPVSE